MARDARRGVGYKTDGIYGVLRISLHYGVRRSSKVMLENGAYTVTVDGSLEEGGAYEFGGRGGGGGLATLSTTIAHRCHPENMTGCNRQNQAPKDRVVFLSLGGLEFCLFLSCSTADADEGDAVGFRL